MYKARQNGKLVHNEAQPPPEGVPDMMSEEVKEILGAPPRWIVQWGNILLLLIVLLLIVLSGFIKYPEIAAGRISLTPAFEPTPIRAPAGPILLSPDVHDGDSVREGQLIFNHFRSPAAGKIIFQRWFPAGGSLPEGTTLMLIVPLRRDFSALVRLPAARSGKIQLGQQVVVSMDNYPAAEFGNLTGIVVSMPQYEENTVTIAVKLDHAGYTTFKKELAIYSPMEGTAEITTTKRRLISQVFSFLK